MNSINKKRRQILKGVSSLWAVPFMGSWSMADSVKKSEIIISSNNIEIEKFLMQGVSLKDKIVKKVDFVTQYSKSINSVYSLAKSYKPAGVLSVFTYSDFILLSQSAKQKNLKISNEIFMNQNDAKFVSFLITVNKEPKYV